MRVTQHHCCDYTNEIEMNLQKYNIKYELFEPDLSRKLLIFDIYLDSSGYENIMKACGGQYSCRWLEFTKKELNEAAWLMFYCKNLSIDLEFEEESFYVEEPLGANRSNHRYRTDSPLYLSRPVKWTNRKHFAASYDMGSNVMFCDEKIKSILSSICTDVSFDTVYGKNREPISQTYLMNIQNLLDETAIHFTGDEHKIECPVCHKVQYGYDATYQFHISKQALSTFDYLCKTPPIFGFGNLTSSVNFMSHELYQILSEQKLVQNMNFIPVILE